MVNIYTISKKPFWGDRNQVLAINDSLVKGLGILTCDFEIRTAEIDWHDIDRFVEEIGRSRDTSVIIASGDHGIDFISSLGSKGILSDQIVTVWSGHHIFAKLMSVDLNNFNFIALPVYTVQDDFLQRAKNSKSRVMPVNTVPILFNFDAIKVAYNDFSLKNLIPEEGRYLVVFFGGDAPDESGLIHKITDNEIRNFASYAARIATDQNAEIVITNNPRTTKEQMDIFLEKLHEYKSEVAHFNFHDGIRAYKPLLYLLKETPSVAMISGESTSMVDEIIYTTGKPAYVMTLSSMSDAHIAHIRHEGSLGNIGVIDTGSFDETSIPVLSNDLLIEERSADVIAGEVLPLITIL